MHNRLPEDMILEGVLEQVTGLLTQTNFQLVLIAVLVSGLIRGFAGFGTGLILIPIVAALYSPATAMVFVMVMDTWPNFPVVWKCRKQVDWVEIFPVLAGAAVTLPVGLIFLKYGNTEAIRWLVSITITVFVILIIRGWQYRGQRTFKTSLAVGGISGFLGGSSGLSGPPAIMYWASKKAGIENMRANLTTFLLLSEVGSFIGLYLANLFTREAVIMGLLSSPVYLVGQLIGSSLFGKTSEKTYRLVALSLIILVAVSASPAMDDLFRAANV